MFNFKIKCYGKCKGNKLEKTVFLGLGLMIATFVAAAVVFDVPGPPGRPSAYDIESDRAVLQFRKPKSDGGARIQHYRIYYTVPSWGSRWLYLCRVQPQSNEDEVIECVLENRFGENIPVVFRVTAVNAAGESRPSISSDEITFRDPFIW